YDLRMENLRIESGYVAMDKSEETGSLLQAAGSIYTLGRMGRVILEGEVAYSHGGERPYRLNDSQAWFEETAPWAPVYSDTSGTQLQSWIGKSDFASSFRMGLESETLTPYLS